MVTLPAQRRAEPPVVGKGGRRSIKLIRLLAQQAYTTVCDLVFPPICVSCERVGSFLCDRCLATIEAAPRRVLPAFDGLVVRAVYTGPIRDSIHAFKYLNQTRLAGPLTDLLENTVRDQGWEVDLVTAVPMHESRLRERGYNQAALLARSLAERQGWPFVPEAIRRIRATASQVTLSASERKENVAGAFEASEQLVHARRVLIVDDVLTTGATLSACADALRAAGALMVFGAAVASAVDDRMDSRNR